MGAVRKGGSEFKLLFSPLLFSGIDFVLHVVLISGPVWSKQQTVDHRHPQNLSYYAISWPRAGHWHCLTSSPWFWRWEVCYLLLREYDNYLTNVVWRSVMVSPSNWVFWIPFTFPSLNWPASPMSCRNVRQPELVPWSLFLLYSLQ